jgi:hypothetical protein
MPAWYKIVLPLLSASGEEVFTDDHLLTLFDMFERRCGGSLASSGVARLFQLLKGILKKGGYQPQDEILIERAPMWLVEAAEHLR